MSVIQLTTHNFRNLANQQTELHPDLNFFVGDNGSGKSSLLEAIFFIGHAKSYRTTNIESIANHEKTHFVISVKDNKLNQLGIGKDIVSKHLDIKINGEKLSRLSALVKNIAVQIITPESFKLFFGGPKERRRFVDLGLFHVKHEFSNLWRDFNRVLKQRNACLRSRVDKNTLAYWTTSFCHYSQLVADIRADYISELELELKNWLPIMLPELDSSFTLQYLQGWNQRKELLDILNASMEKEYSYGYCIAGAHKFDVRFFVNKISVEHTLSRGQQKLFLLALTFAQAKLIEKVNQVKPILLIDDFGAELDIISRTALAAAIEKLNCQVVITAIDQVVLEPIVPSNNNYKMFHVKHGEISAMSK